MVNSDLDENLIPALTSGELAVVAETKESMRRIFDYCSMQLANVEIGSSTRYMLGDIHAQAAEVLHDLDGMLFMLHPTNEGESGNG